MKLSRGRRLRFGLRHTRLFQVEVEVLVEVEVQVHVDV